MLVANVLPHFFSIGPLLDFIINHRPYALISCYFVFRDKQIDQSSIIVVELYVIFILKVIFHALLPVRVDVGVNEVEICEEIV